MIINHACCVCCSFTFDLLRCVLLLALLVALVVVVVVVVVAVQ